MTKQHLTWLALLGGTAAGLGCAGDPPSEPNAPISVGTAATDLAAARSAPVRFFVPPPDAGAKEQIADLLRTWHLGDALRLTALEATPSAVWFTGGTPDDVLKSVRRTMTAAARENRVPILVAYNIPFRDCAGYSAGGFGSAFTAQ